MEYDPIKDKLAAILLGSPLLRKFLFFLERQVFLRELVIRSELRKMKRNGFKPARILDAGTGYGQYAYYLSRLFPDAQIISIDIKADSMRQMQNFCNAESIDNLDCAQMDLLQLEATEGYDMILNVDVMEHIDDDNKVFRNFKKVLNQNGRLLLHTPALAENSPLIADKTDFSVGEHVREGYRHSEMRDRLAKAGFRNIIITPTYGSIGGIGWKLGVRLPMQMLGLSLLTLPLVLIWLVLVILPVRILNSIDICVNKKYGGCLLVEAKVE
jgi:SAM-dependent methyltransferase